MFKLRKHALPILFACAPVLAGLPAAFADPEAPDLTLSFTTERRRRMAVAGSTTAMPVRTARTEKPPFGCC